ncbi:TPA: hypothetical protein ACQVG8_003500, partial [Serratia marcescens]
SDASAHRSRADNRSRLNCRITFCHRKSPSLYAMRNSQMLIISLDLRRHWVPVWKVIGGVLAV